MLRKLPLLLFILIAGGLSAQTIVSTEPQNRNVVLEEFTGIYCVHCPDGHSIAQAIQNANPDRVSLINIHEGGFASPNGNHPDFRTIWGAAIERQAGVTGYPAGTVNRHVFPGRGLRAGGTAMGRGSWTVSANEILAMPSYVNIGVEATYDVETNTMTIHVEAYYTGDSPESTNMLNIAVLQHNTKGPQTGGGQGNNYNHMHRLIDLVTGQWGDKINQTTAGSFIDRTYSYELIHHNNDIPVEIGDLEIVAFITETHQEIITGSRTTPVLEGIAHSNDARVRFIAGLGDDCLGDEVSYSPKVNIQNVGTSPINSLDIEYGPNGNTSTMTFNQTIEPLKSATVSLPQFTTTITESNTYEVTISDDDNNDNNTLNVPFGATYTSGTMDVYIHTGALGDKLRWRIRDGNNRQVAGGGPYQPWEVIYERINLEEDCYTILLAASGGDNDNFIVFKDHEGTVVVETDRAFGNSLTTRFYASGVLQVEDNSLEGVQLFPNPAQDLLTITNAEQAEIRIFNILGQELLKTTALSSNETVNVSAFQSGSYFVKISKDGKTTTKKLLIR